VDVTLARGGEPLDMGDPGETAPSGGAPFRIRTFSDGLTGEQASNRMALNLAMALAGFVPFWGEWWHYSYGDREWAAFCGLPDAIYGPVAGP
jgi:D-alanyl-D-alanine dipeptidase